MINVHDLVEFKRSFRRPWEPGYVEQVERYAIHVRAALGSRADLVVIQLAGPNRCGKVRELSSDRAAAVIATIRASIKPQVTLSDLPMLRVVRTDRGALREVPKARPRYLAPAFLAFVRTWKCCGCDLQRGPTEAHHVGARGVGQKADDYGAVPVCRPCHQLVTDRGILPGLDEAETERRFMAVSQMLLIEWAARADRLVSMPVLRIVAACLAVLVGLGGDYSGVKSARAAGALQEASARGAVVARLGGGQSLVTPNGAQDVLQEPSVEPAPKHHGSKDTEGEDDHVGLRLVLHADEHDDGDSADDHRKGREPQRMTCGRMLCLDAVALHLGLGLDDARLDLGELGLRVDRLFVHGGLDLSQLQRALLVPEQRLPRLLDHETKHAGRKRVLVVLRINRLGLGGPRAGGLGGLASSGARGLGLIGLDQGRLASGGSGLGRGAWADGGCSGRGFVCGCQFSTTAIRHGVPISLWLVRQSSRWPIPSRGRFSSSGGHCGGCFGDGGQRIDPPSLPLARDAYCERSEVATGPRRALSGAIALGVAEGGPTFAGAHYSPANSGRAAGALQAQVVMVTCSLELPCTRGMRQGARSPLSSVKGRAGRAQAPEGAAPGGVDGEDPLRSGLAGHSGSEGLVRGGLQDRDEGQGGRGGLRAQHDRCPTTGAGYQHRYTFGVGALPAAHAWRTINASGREQPGSRIEDCGQDTDSPSLSLPGVPRLRRVIPGRVFSSFSSAGQTSSSHGQFRAAVSFLLAGPACDGTRQQQTLSACRQIAILWIYHTIAIAAAEVAHA